MHGFIDRPKEIILMPDGYGKLYPAGGQVEAHYQAASWTLRHLLTARTFLFIGFGLEAALEQEIRWVRETFAGAGVPHFVLVRDQDRAAMFERTTRTVGPACLLHRFRAAVAPLSR